MLSRYRRVARLGTPVIQLFSILHILFIISIMHNTKPPAGLVIIVPGTGLLRLPCAREGPYPVSHRRFLPGTK